MSKDAGVILAVEELEDVLEEMKPLFEEHWAEVAIYQDKISLSPDYDKYLELAQAGTLHVVTAREEGVLIGYFVSFICQHLHYQEVTYANNDILFLHPSHRGGDTALSMFMFAEECLKEIGVEVLTIHMKTALPFDSLCEALEYSYVERIYSKYIKKVSE